MAPRARLPDWKRWVERWEAQQARHVRGRESRFTTMLEAVGALAPADLRALDLGCGPGSLSQRLVARFPRARVVAVDFDPVLLALGRHALSRYDRRLSWVEADLRDARWVEALPAGPFDAILSTTALHWLAAPDVLRLYRQLHTLLRPRGLFMNGDQMTFDPGQPTFRALARAIHRRRSEEGGRGRSAEDWDLWWERLEAEPALAPLFAERKRRFPRAHHGDHEFMARFHESGLKEAGFREVGTIWQEVDNRVVLAVA